MGQNNSKQKPHFEKPSSSHDATLFYFRGRGRADQIRWVLAAAGLSFTQKVVSSRPHFLRMAERQLPFGQLPLLLIDGHEIVQSQAAVRYIAKKAGLIGATPEDELKCDMIAESVNDLLPLCLSEPFVKRKSPEEYEKHLALMRAKWDFAATRFEGILRISGRSKHFASDQLTYADVLVGHATTWFVEVLGSDIMKPYPRLTFLQINIMSLPSISEFIKSDSFYPLGDDEYCEQVSTVLGRKI